MLYKSVLYLSILSFKKDIVSFIPSCSEYCGLHSVNCFIFSLHPSNLFTSLFSGRSLCLSQIIFAAGLICLINSSANSPIEISFCVAMFISSPTVLFELYIFIC